MNEYRPIESLRNWDKNPRTVTPENIERLKRQINQLGQYKPLIITADGTVLGGNMRLTAYRELNIDKVWVNVVTAETEADKLAYALSDNDRIGSYDEVALQQLITATPDLHIEDYAIDVGEPTLLTQLTAPTAPAPPPEQTYASQFQIIVECTNEIEQQELYDKLTGMGLSCKVLTL